MHFVCMKTTKTFATIEAAATYMLLLQNPRDWKIVRTPSGKFSLRFKRI